MLNALLNWSPRYFELHPFCEREFSEPGDLTFGRPAGAAAPHGFGTMTLTLCVPLVTKHFQSEVSRTWYIFRRG